MSLINDALKDLDERSRKKIDYSATAECNNRGSYAPLSRKSHLKSILFSLGFAALLSLGIWNFVDSRGEQDSIRAMASEEIHSIKDIGENNTLAVNSGGIEVGENNRVKRAEENKERSETVKNLLSLASAAIAKDRLTKPKNANALYYYQQALEKEGDNEAALAGIEIVNQRYLFLLSSSINEKKIAYAESLVENYSILGRFSGEFSTLKNALSQLKKERRVNEKVQVVADKKNNPIYIASNKDEKNSTIDLGINKSEAFKEDQVIDAGKAHIAEGRPLIATEMWANFLEEHPQAERLRLILFEHYVAENSRDKAENLIAVFKDKKPIYYQARMLLLSKNIKPALALLENQLPSGIYVEPHNALLAALYQQEKQYDKAVTFYKALIKQAPRKPAYWLGLGISSDALGNRQDALKAYQIVEGFDDHTRPIKEYIGQRIALLTKALQGSQVAEAEVW